MGLLHICDSPISCKGKEAILVKQFTLTKQHIRAIVCWVVLLVAFIIAVTVVNRPDPDAPPSYASTRVFVPAKVVEIQSDQASPDKWTEGIRIGNQLLLLQIESGQHKGEQLPAINYLSAYSNIDPNIGTRLIVNLDYNAQGEVYIVYIYSYDRMPAYLGFALLFAAIIVLIGGKRGFMALVGLAFTLACLWFLLVPLMLQGVRPLPVTICIIALCTAVSLLALGGFTRKTLCAVLGCVGGVLIAGLCAQIVSSISPVTGFSTAEAEGLVLLGKDGGLEIKGLLVCGILIASLGAVMDVAMAISSAVEELRTVNNKLTAKQLFHSGMNIGRDAMGTMANTLILAFVGSSLNSLLMFQIYDYPLIQIMNSDLMVIEMLQGLSGTMGIVLTVPLIAAVSAKIMSTKK